MNQLPRISEAEWEVMKLLWNESPLRANFIVEKLKPRTKWQPKTIKTLLNRLVKKEAIGFEKTGREYLYFPLVEEVECVKAECRSFLQRVHSGALQPMLAAFLELEEVTEDDVKELKKILNKNRSK